MNFSKEQILEACRTYGPSLLVVSGISGPRVMAALASNESSYGLNCGPRHEPAYDVNGAIYKSNPLQRNLVKEFGSAAACSYGPWQMMYINFKGALPSELQNDLTLLAQEFVHWFNTYVIKIRHAETVEQIGQVWNLGHITKEPQPGVLRYTQDLQKAYDSVEL